MRLTPLQGLFLAHTVFYLWLSPFLGARGRNSNGNRNRNRNGNGKSHCAKGLKTAGTHKARNKSFLPSSQRLHVRKVKEGEMLHKGEPEPAYGLGTVKSKWGAQGKKEGSRAGEEGQETCIPSGSLRWMGVLPLFSVDTAFLLINLLFLPPYKISNLLLHKIQQYTEFYRLLCELEDSWESAVSYSNTLSRAING